VPICLVDCANIIYLSTYSTVLCFVIIGSVLTRDEYR